MTSESFGHHDSGPRTSRNKTQHTRAGSLDCTTVVSLSLLPSPREEESHRLGIREVGMADVTPHHRRNVIRGVEGHDKIKVTSNTKKLKNDPISDGAYHIRDVLTNQLIELARKMV